MSRTKQLLLHSLPLVGGVFLSYLFWQSTYLLLVLYVTIVVAFILSGQDKGIEFKIFGYGLIAGFIIEIIGTQISGYQSFTKPDFIGIPLWLPVSWAYGFILMKRIALIIAKNSPWIEA